MNSRVLIIFKKNPELGKVKTRLASDIGEDKALEVYIELLDKCKMECLQVEAAKHLYYHEEIRSDDWSEESFIKHVQKDGDLGLKMEDAVSSSFNSGASSVVIIGSDCYDLDHHLISSAFDLLEKTDLVLGPANDGGYYLIGMNEVHSQLFKNINWSTDQVLKQTLKKAEDSNLTYFLLEELIDLDNFDDLKQSGFPKDSY